MGDSFVFGTGGHEQDRWTDQMARWLEQHGLLPEEQQVEVYSCGIGSWTALNEAAYLESRLSEYAPNIVIVLFTPNDITDGSAVTGLGQATTAFSPEARALGSGAFFDDAARAFGVDARSPLALGCTPESEARWQRAFQAWKRVEDLLQETQAQLLLSVLNSKALFVELCKHWAQRLGLRAPLLVVDYFNERLEHDGHPSRVGHGILAAHYLHELAELGWLELKREALPPLHAGLSLSQAGATVFEPSHWQHLAELQAAQWRSYPEELDFNQLDARQVRCFLGGIFPRLQHDPWTGPPDASVRAGFVLRRKPGAQRLALSVAVPARPELYPLEVRVSIHGQSMATFHLESVQQAGPQHWELTLPPGDAPLLEVILEANHYTCNIADPTMRSYQLRGVQQLP